MKLSHRYISGRQLPDKSVSVLDTACARVAIGQSNVPAAIEDAERRIDHLTVEIDVLEREPVTGSDHDKRIEELRAERSAEEERLNNLIARWDSEKALISQIQKIREQLEQQATKSEEGDGAAKASAAAMASASSVAKARQSATGQAYTAAGVIEESSTASASVNADELRAELARLNQELESVQGETPLMQACVTSQTIAEVISGWTGIPVGKMLADEINTVIALRDTARKARHRTVASARSHQPAHSHCAGKSDRPAQARWRLPARRPERRRQNRNGFDACRHALRRRAKPDHDQYERVSGSAYSLFAQRVASRLCGLWRRRRADGSRAAQATFGRAA